MEVILNGGKLFIVLALLRFFANWAVDSQFQCRQCQDLLENNLAHKRPIEGSSLYFAKPIWERGCLIYLTCSSYRKEEFGG